MSNEIKAASSASWKNDCDAFLQIKQQKNSGNAQRQSINKLQEDPLRIHLDSCLNNINCDN